MSVSPPPGDPRSLIDPPKPPESPSVRADDLKTPTVPPADASEAKPADAIDKAAKKAARREERARKASEEVERLRLDPMVVGESRLDRVASALMAAVIGATLAVGWLYLRVLTQYAFVEPSPAPVEIIEVEGGGGGSPDGQLGATEAVNVAGAAVSTQASNNMEEASEFEPPSIELTSSAAIDALADVASSDIVEMDIAEALPNAGMVATGQRASKLGTGKAFGFGPGPGGGVPREQRWSIVFAPGQTPDEYARQLDFLGVELATPSSAGSLDYASNFSRASPSRRVGLASADKRLYFLWQGAGRKSSDMQLLQKAGISVGNKAIFQFYPKKVEDQLAQLEYQFAKRQPAQIRSTRFQVVQSGRSYTIKVLSQEPMPGGG